MGDLSDQMLARRWQLDPRRSSVEFRVRHFWGLRTIKGHFDEYEGRLELGADPAIELTVDPATVQTGNRQRDKHLRSPDFFDVESDWPVRFVSDSVEVHDQTLTVRGKLFARDQSIPLELNAEVSEADGELAIKASATAPHRELGMTYSPLGMIMGSSELLVNGYLVPAAGPRNGSA
jgi:polyisoprenoid-binding protein YceI